MFLIYENNIFLGGLGEDNVTLSGLSLFQLSVLRRQINKHGALVGLKRAGWKPKSSSSSSSLYICHVVGPLV